MKTSFHKLHPKTTVFGSSKRFHFGASRLNPSESSGIQGRNTLESYTASFDGPKRWSSEFANPLPIRRCDRRSLFERNRSQEFDSHLSHSSIMSQEIAERFSRGFWPLLRIRAMACRQMSDSIPLNTRHTNRDGRHRQTLGGGGGDLSSSDASDWQDTAIFSIADRGETLNDHSQPSRCGSTRGTTLPQRHA